MNTIRQELEEYLSIKYSSTRIDAEHTLAGEITLRFNSTEDDSSEAQDRIAQGVERATLVWHTLFDKAKNPLWVIAYEYMEDHLIEYERDYFFQQFKQDAANEFVFSDEHVNSRMISIDENGIEVFEKVKAKLSIGKTYSQNVNIENILRGIANRDNGYEPIIGQSIYFLDPTNHTGFHMSDDRGFFAWANEADKLRKLYNEHANWISEYTKEDIEPYFQ